VVGPATEVDVENSKFREPWILDYFLMHMWTRQRRMRAIVSVIQTLGNHILLDRIKVTIGRGIREWWLRCSMSGCAVVYASQ